MKNAIVIIDGSGVIGVDAEKLLLVREVIKHFGPRWKHNVQVAVSEGKEPNVLGLVGNMLQKLSIEFEVIENVEAVSVVDASESEDYQDYESEEA